MTSFRAENRKTTILVVDDEESILRTLKDGLVNEGFKVITAKDVSDALHICPQKTFQYALIDIRLPDGSGIDLSVEIKKYKPGVIIILMTGYPGIKSAVQALRNQVYDYLIKPFRIEQIISVIDRSRREVKLIGKNFYSEEMIRALKEENKQLKATLKELMPDETRIRAKSFDKIRTLQSDQNVAIRSYSLQQGDDLNKKQNK